MRRDVLNWTLRVWLNSYWIKRSWVWHGLIRHLRRNCDRYGNILAETLTARTSMEEKMRQNEGRLSDFPDPLGWGLSASQISMCTSLSEKRRMTPEAIQRSTGSPPVFQRVRPSRGLQQARASAWSLRHGPHCQAWSRGCLGPWEPALPSRALRVGPPHQWALKAVPLWVRKAGHSAKEEP